MEVQPLSGTQKSFMNEERKLNCTIVGSFRFKREIDLAREEFEDSGVEVLAPEKGQVLVPRRTLFKPKEQVFRPLSLERNMPIKVVEDNFLRDIERSDLVYIVAVDGYMGASTSMELGFAAGMGKRIFSNEDICMSPDTPIERQFLIRESVRTMLPSEAVAEVRKIMCWPD